MMADPCTVAKAATEQGLETLVGDVAAMNLHRGGRYARAVELVVSSALWLQSVLYKLAHGGRGQPPIGPLRRAPFPPG